MELAQLPPHISRPFLHRMLQRFSGMRLLKEFPQKQCFVYLKRERLRKHLEIDEHILIF